jgi:hypothetical protein
MLLEFLEEKKKEQYIFLPLATNFFLSCLCTLDHQLVRWWHDNAIVILVMPP